MCIIGHGTLAEWNWPDLAWVHREEAIEKDKNANKGCGDQHASVPAQPRKVKTDFLTKVASGSKTKKRSGEFYTIIYVDG